ncbi:MAG TPA: AMP-binding protein [Candidatus Tectomicrobia bacterium]
MSEVGWSRHSAAPGFNSHRSKFIILSNSPTASPAAASLGDTRDGVKALARMLPDGGLQRGERVAIYSPNCPEYAVVARGISMAGGTLSTLNPLYHGHEVVYQLVDAGTKVLFYHPQPRAYHRVCYHENSEKEFSLVTV